MSVTFESHTVKTALHALVDIALDNKPCELIIEINARNKEQLKLHAEMGTKFQFGTEVNRVIDISSDTAPAQLWDFGLELIHMITEVNEQ